MAKSKRSLARRRAPQSNRAKPSHLTMSEEALNTERHSFSRSSAQLRYRRIDFISAGQLKSDQPMHSNRSVIPATDLPIPELPNTATKASTCFDLAKLQPALEETLDSERAGGPTGTFDSDEDEVVFAGRSSFNTSRTNICETGPPEVIHQSGEDSGSPSSDPELIVDSDEELDISDAIVADYLAHIDELDSSDDEPLPSAAEDDIPNNAWLSHPDDVSGLSDSGIPQQIQEDVFVSGSKASIERRKISKLLSAPTLNLDLDSYGDFDIMDFERPSLKKNHRNKPPPMLELSDSELEWQIALAWDKDRKKKREAKKQRQELRSQGLLGKRKTPISSSPGDLKIIQRDIRAFLLSSNEILCLPPMEKKVRKYIHDFANSISLKSQSRGHGRSRFPVLTKTSRTRTFDSETIDNIEALYRFSAPLLATERSRTHGNGAKSASYTHGEVVGASAPELGIENRGRIMLEKMGWTNGSALGALQGGILHPVTHIVRKNKTCLG